MGSSKKIDFPEKMDVSSYNIIDSHCHVGGYYKFHYADGDIDALVKGMDEIGVSKIAVSSITAIEVDCVKGNDMVAEAVRKYPDRVIGMAAVNPNRPEEITGELIRCFDRLNLSMIKLHPAFYACPMTSPNYEPVYEFANERRLCILNHSWEDPKLLERLSIKYPEINFIQAHSAGNWDGHREDGFIELAKYQENVYVDIVASPVFYDALEKLVDKVGANKILFGSDYPFLNLGFGIGKVVLSDLSEEEKRLIFHDNFHRILYRD